MSTATLVKSDQITNRVALDRAQRPVTRLQDVLIAFEIRYNTMVGIQEILAAKSFRLSLENLRDDAPAVSYIYK